MPHTKHPLTIVFTTDQNYAQHLAVLIQSILNHHPVNVPLQLFVLDLDIHLNTRNQLIELVEKNAKKSDTTCSYKIDFIPVNKEDFTQFPLTVQYISLASYVRLKLSDYIPTNIEKLIYLDIDILVKDSLLPLWEINLQDKIIGACYDAYIESIDYKHIIELKSQQLYFNAGVLLIDMCKWRAANVYEKTIQCIEKYKNIIKYQDQDVLNILFKNKVYYLDMRYNFMPAHYNLEKKSYREKIPLTGPMATTMPIAIIHYCGEEKAWHSHSNHHVYAYLYEKIKKSLPIQKLETSPIFSVLRFYELIQQYHNWRKLLKRQYRDWRNRRKYHIY